MRYPKLFIDFFIFPFDLIFICKKNIMVYIGSKNRIAKHIIPIITKDLKDNQFYVEPFVGGANLISKIEHKNKIGADNNMYLIALLQHVQNNLPLPNHITKGEYVHIKNNKDKYPEWLVGYCAFICSYRGGFFKSYAYHSTRDFQQECKKNLLKQDLSNITFKCCDYRELDIPNDSIIYCDPPYQNTEKYNTDFDSNEFWDWCRTKASEGHQVFVSEYQAPSDFVCVFEKQINNTLSCNTIKTATEKLFINKKGIH